MDEWLSVSEVSDELGISPQAVYRLIGRGSLASGVIAGKRVVRRSALRALRESPVYIRMSKGRRKVDRVELQGELDV